MVSVDGEGADVQHRQVGGELLEKSATPGVPHLEQNKAFIDHLYLSRSILKSLLNPFSKASWIERNSLVHGFRGKLTGSPAK